MNISKLYQRAHALRMADRQDGTAVAPEEFYIGVVIADCFINPEVTNGVIEFLRATEADVVSKALRRFARSPEGLHEELLVRLHWSENWARVWRSLLTTYGDKPLLLLAIADGMEA